MNEIAIGSCVRLRINLCTKDTRVVLVPAGTQGIVDDIIEAEEETYFDVMIDDLHFSLLSSQIEIVLPSTEN